MGEIRIIEISLAQGPSFVKNGPKCYCGQKDWIIKPNAAVCSNCGREKEGRFSGYVVDGPKCYCGYRDWFASDENWICTNCGRSK